MHSCLLDRSLYFSGRWLPRAWTISGVTGVGTFSAFRTQESRIGHLGVRVCGISSAICMVTCDMCRQIFALSASILPYPARSAKCHILLLIPWRTHLASDPFYPGRSTQRCFTRRDRWRPTCRPPTARPCRPPSFKPIDTIGDTVIAVVGVRHSHVFASAKSIQ